MIKYYYFKANHKINRSYFDEIIRKSYTAYIDIDYYDESSGIILSDENFFIRLSSIYDILVQDLNINLIFLESYKLHDLAFEAIKILYLQQNYGCYYLAQVILKEKLKNNEVLLRNLKKEFECIDKELLDTAYAYLKCNLNAKNTAKLQYIHRNTFNYRLNKFIDITQLDIRNFNNSLILFLLYL